MSKLHAFLAIPKLCTIYMFFSLQYNVCLSCYLIWLVELMDYVVSARGSQCCPVAHLVPT